MLIDLRAGLSEFSAPILFDPRVKKYIVTSTSYQSVKGTEILLQQLNKGLPLNENSKIPEVLLTMVQNGMKTDEITINDEMFANAKLHNPKGKWLAIFGVNTLPEYRNRGLAGKLMETVILETKKQGCKGCILTCKDKLVHYYEKFGYKNKGISKSVHGGAVWYDMILEFKDE